MPKKSLREPNDFCVEEMMRDQRKINDRRLKARVKRIALKEHGLHLTSEEVAFFVRMFKKELGLSVMLKQTKEAN